jgi:hypothetical protein
MDAYGRKIVQGGHAPFPSHFACYALPQDCMQSASRGCWEEKPYASYYNIRCSLPWDTNWGRSDWSDKFALPLGVGDDDSRTQQKNSTPLRVLPTDYVPLPYTLHIEEITPISNRKLVQFSQQGRAI